MQSSLHCELVGWGQVERLARKLADKIQKAAYQPDIVVAIARGGYVPARLLCDYLDIFNLTSIRIIHYAAGADQLPGARLSMGLCTDIRDLKVLVVDDVSDTGDTLQLAMRHIQDYKPANIKLAVLHHKVVSQVHPDFYGQKLVKWRWLTYPWAIHEDVGQFIARMSPQPGSVAEAMQRLQDEYRIKVPERLVGGLLYKALGQGISGPENISK